jgi:8-oxo-dGTP pyrophosphatase MutT (NUDIX family)
MDPKDKKTPVASAVVIRHSEFPELILHGKRRDINEWSIPGGHVHKHESLKDAAVRETKEETGLQLDPNDLEHIGTEHYNTKEDKHLTVHLFVCKKPYHHESMDFTGDKDEEFKELKFINPLEHDDLYQPNGENIVTTYLKGELKKPEISKSEELDKGVMKRLFPFNPKKDVKTEDKSDLRLWQTYGNYGYSGETIDDIDDVKYVREGLSEINQNAKMRALNKLTGIAKTKINPETKEREFLLHRGVSSSEFKDSTDGKHAYHQNKTSWMPFSDLAEKYRDSHYSTSGRIDRKKSKKDSGKVISAWISEKNIHHIPKMYGAIHTPTSHGFNEYQEENEIIVNPHKSALATSEEIRGKNDILRNKLKDNYLKNISKQFQKPQKLAATEKSELKNLEIYQFFHNISNNLIKVEVKDKNNLQVAEASFKIELDSLIVPESLQIDRKHDQAGLQKEMYIYADEVLTLNKQELEKMSQPALRFKKLTKLPTRPEQDVKLINPEPLKVPSRTKEEKDIEELSGGPRTISRQSLENKKIANKILMMHPEASKSPKEKRESERKALEAHIGGGEDVISPEGTFTTSGYTSGFGDLPVSQPYEVKKPWPTSEGNVTQEHEATHHLLNHLRFKYGENTKNRVVDHLLNVHLHPNEREAIEKLIRSKPSYRDLPEGEFNEEVLTHLRDLLVSKRKREDHNSLKMQQPKYWQPIDYKRLKSSWKQLTGHAKRMTEKDLNKLMGKNEGQIDFEKLFKAKKLKTKQFKRFYLDRKKDHSGNTGSGIVAVGVQFPGGKCIVNWMTDTPSFNFYDSLDDIKEVHGHDGDTEINFMDDFNKTEEMKKFEDIHEKLASRSKYLRKDPLHKLPFLFLNKRFMGKD